jgi:hypothetical protein
VLTQSSCKILYLLINLCYILVMHYVILQESYAVGNERRYYVLREAGKLHNVFRTSMRKKHLRDSDGNYNEHPPRHIHPQITQEEWDSFVARSKSEKFQVVYRCWLVFFLYFVLSLYLFNQCRNLVKTTGKGH